MSSGDFIKIFRAKYHPILDLVSSYGLIVRGKADWAAISVCFEEDTFPRALLGGIDDRLEQRVWDRCETF